MVSSANTPALLPALQAQLDNLRKLNTQDIQNSWQWHDQDIAISGLNQPETYKEWTTASLNDRHHIAWEKGLKIRWLIQTITVPTDLYGYPLTGLTLRLALTWWAQDAQIYIDGTLVQSGDLFECFTRICLSDRAQPNDTFQVAIRLVSPQHDNGALVRSHLTYELIGQPTPEPSFIADELTVLATLEPNSQSDIQSALNHLNWSSLAAPAESNINFEPNADDLWHSLSATSALPAATIHPFQQSLSTLRRSLLPYSSALKERTIHCVGHAHLDMAWLWPIEDTWKAAERTFRSILSLQNDFPELTYTHSSPALFEWIEHNRPKLFQTIQTKVKEGSWSIDAGLWIEPELNIIGGEAIVRQILYGQRYCQEKFGAISKIAWLPDTFGFCWQLPQLLVQGGIETFATLKLTWNDTTEFPHQFFWWQSPDGTKIRSIMLPPIGSDIDPLKMSAYAVKWTNNTQSPDSLWLPGLGDHGGGPTRDMLEKSQRWEKSPFFPKLSFTTPEQYISEIPTNTLPPIPTWNDELYLELHRGCYTTHADQKQNNRQCEDLLYQAEAFATVAQLIAQQPYPKQDIEIAWKTLLFNQFHDILPGTSIPEVFIEADQGWQQVKDIGQSVLENSLQAIASKINLSFPQSKAIPILIFNALTWPRSSVITVDISKIVPNVANQSWAIYDKEQNLVSFQRTTPQNNPSTSHAIQVSFLAQDTPALGYQCYWVVPTNPVPTEPSYEPQTYHLENEFITVSISAETGEISSLIERTTNKEILSAPSNQLQLFRDQSGYWDAWDIATDYQENQLPSPQLTSIQWQESGPIRQRLRTRYETKESTIIQDYILDKSAPFLKIKQHIHWNETHTLLKALFPFTISAPFATYEIPFGSIQRTTQPKTKREQAKWEVPALRWANLTQTKNNKTLGVSILTQAKHGFDNRPNHLRLTLLKSPTWPDSNADKGEHHITYAIYPHATTWQSAQTAHHARELNSPLIIHYPHSNSAQTAPLPNVHSFLENHTTSFIVSTLKPAEDNPSQIVLRGYEAYGQVTQIDIVNTLNLSTSTGHIRRTNILEQKTATEQLLEVQPYQIATYQMSTTEQKNSPASQS